MALAPELKIIAPWKDPLRADQPRGGHRIRQGARHPHRADARRRSTRATATSGTSRHEGADLEDPANEPKDDLWVMSRARLQGPRQAASTCTIDFQAGRAGGRQRQEDGRPRDHRRAQRDRRPARRRADRPGREPAGRHEEPRGLRDARRHDPLRSRTGPWRRSRSTARPPTTSSRSR